MARQRSAVARRDRNGARLDVREGAENVDLGRKAHKSHLAGKPDTGCLRKEGETMKRALLGGAFGLTLASAGIYAATTTLPKPAPPFEGKIERSYKDSTPSFPAQLHAPKGA